MEADKVYGHKTFLEGNEVGFTIFKDVFSGNWVLKGSGTASKIGGKYISKEQLDVVAKLFGLK
ncbi:hypothetical protein D3C72_2562200 [compost metagenome]